MAVDGRSSTCLAHVHSNTLVLRSLESTGNSLRTRAYYALDGKGS